MTTPTGFTEFERLVESAVGLGIPRAKAEREIRAQRPDLAPVITSNAAEDASRILEKAEQVEVRKLLIAHGFNIYNLSQARASKQTPGLPDLWCVHKRDRVAFWWEVKRQVGGKLSTAQEEFAAECVRAGVGHYVGDRHACVRLLLGLGLAQPGEGPYDTEPTTARG